MDDCICSLQIMMKGEQFMSELNSRDEQMSEEVGIMAELGKFEIEFTMYGCAFYEKEKVHYAVSENAKKIYDFMYDITNAEKMPTDIHSVSVRTLVPSGAEPYILNEVRNKLVDKLFHLYDEQYFSVLFKLQNVLRNNDAYILLKDLRIQLDGVCNREQLQLFQGLVETAYRRKILWTESYMEFMQWIGWTKQDLEQEPIKSDLYKKTFYGFAYLKENEPLKIHVDGYKNNIYKRIEQKRAQGYEVSNVIQKTYWYNNYYSVTQAKKDFEKYFTTLIGTWYTDCIFKMHQIKTPISQNLFDDLLEEIVDRKNVTVYTSCIRQRGIWNM